MLDLLLEVVGNVVAVGNVSDSSQRRAGCELCVERGQPAITQYMHHALLAITDCRSHAPHLTKRSQLKLGAR